MIFGKHINKYYLKHAPILIVGILALIFVDYFQLILPELYRIVVNGMNGGLVEVGGKLVPVFSGASVFTGRRSGWRPICATACLTIAKISRRITFR